MTRVEKIEEFVRAQRLQSFRLIEKTDEINASKDFWLIVQTTCRPKKRCKEVAEKAMLAKWLKKLVLKTAFYECLAQNLALFCLLEKQAGSERTKNKKCQH